LHFACRPFFVKQFGELKKRTPLPGKKTCRKNKVKLKKEEVLMVVWTLEFAKEQLAMWLEADKAVASGQSYTIAGRTMNRVNAQWIQDRILFWGREVARLERGTGGGVRIQYVVPL
jgi:hypothetical protein